MMLLEKVLCFLLCVQIAKMVSGFVHQLQNSDDFDAPSEHFPECTV
jgi:hypothetical protein